MLGLTVTAGDAKTGRLAGRARSRGQSMSGRRSTVVEQLRTMAELSTNFCRQAPSCRLPRSGSHAATGDYRWARDLIDGVRSG